MKHDTTFFHFFLFSTSIIFVFLVMVSINVIFIIFIFINNIISKQCTLLTQENFGSTLDVDQVLWPLFFS